MKNKQTIGQWILWDFKANGELLIKDKNGNNVYHEISDNRWYKIKLDSQGEIIYYENSEGVITDNRFPEIIEHNGRKYQLIPNQIQNP